MNERKIDLALWRYRTRVADTILIGGLGKDFEEKLLEKYEFKK